MSPTPDDQVRVLVVDDHPIWRDAAARSLTEAGFRVAGTAGNGAQALRVPPRPGPMWCCSISTFPITQVPR
jgi:response regulator RpfG family c-di-GMP phosphodiesterase